MSPTSDQAAAPDEGSHASRNGVAATEMTSSLTISNEVPQMAKARHNPTMESKLLSEPHLPAKSPRSSREGSPIRPQTKPPLPGSTQSSRSRKNSQELSPTRSPAMSGSFASIPSAAAVQRALSANKPSMHSATVDGVLEGSRTDKPNRSGDNSPHWPISPRLRSPPPSSSNSRSSIPILRKAESDSTPATATLKRSAASSTFDGSDYFHLKETERDDMQSRAGVRTPARGASVNASGLETVAEGSMPNTPAIGPLLNLSGDHHIESKRLDVNESEFPTKSDISSAKENVGSGTELGGPTDNAEKPDASLKTANAAAIRPASSLAKRSFTNLASTKNRPAPESMRSMTVETETVSSIPQVVLGVNGERGASGRMNSSSSVRPRPSSETIRPKKEKKKQTRKPPSLHSGTVSSKADIFEAKVASAIDETNSSDSEETFVYESNPAERNARNTHHSRTPSATSLASQIDQYGTRNKLNARDASHGVAAKKSMKFTNNAYNSNLDGEVGNQGSTRSSVRNGGSTPRHHHIGRYGRGGHASLFDADSPFTQANKASSPRTSVGNMGKLPRPNSPRTAGGRLPSSPRKSDLYPYDLEGEAADDERTPLVGSVRVNRSRHTRRPFSNSSRLSDYREQQDRSCCSRYGACIIVTLLLLVLCIGAGTFVMALNKPLVDVSVRHIQNVLASEQELMLDLDVQATNPNLFAITVNDLDVNVFAKSGYAGTAALWRGHQSQSASLWTARREQLLGGRGSNYHTAEGVDKGTDPIEDPEGDLQTMLLGEIFDFDSPLMFEPSPLRRRSTSSVGEVRLAKPGNKTEECGSARWERVLQHPFELHVRGVIKYQLPISSKTRSASIDKTFNVVPKEDAIGDDPTPERGVHSSHLL
jgi:hypothetical protein